MNFGISWLPKTINYKDKKTFGNSEIFKKNSFPYLAGIG